MIQYRTPLVFSFRKVIEHMQLLLRPAPFALETLSSYVTRLATVNHYGGISWITELANLQRADLDTIQEPDELVGLATLSGTPVDVLFALTLPGRLGDLPHKPVIGRMKRSARMLARYNLLGTASRVCPACMVETPYRQLPWLMHEITGCPRHRLMLLETCLCGRPLRFPEILDRCPCGRQAISLPRVGLDPFGEKTVQFMSWLYQFEDTRPEIGYPAEDAGREAILTLVNVLRRWVTFLLGDDVPQSPRYPSPGPRRRLPSATAEVDHQLYTSVFQILEEWPTHFYELLDQQRSTPSTRRMKHRFGVSKDFPVLQTLANRYLDPERFTPFYNAFQAYLASRWDGGHVTRLSPFPATEIPDAGFRYMTLNQAKKVLGCDIGRVKEVVSDGILRARVLSHGADGQRIQVLVDSRSCEELARLWADQLSLAETCDALGIGKSEVRRLHRAGIIPNPTARRFQTEFCCDRAALGALLDQLSQRCTAGSAENGWRKLTGHGVSLCKAINLVLAGAVAIRHSTGTGLNAFEIRSTEMTAVNRAFRREHVGLTVPDVAQVLEMPRVLVKAAVEAGILNPTLISTRGQFFSAGVVEDFRVKYVDGEQAQAILGLARVTWGRWLRRGILCPVLSTDRRFRRHLFLREDIETLRQQTGWAITPSAGYGTGGMEQHPGRGQEDLPPNDQNEELLSTQQAARLLGVSSAYISKIARKATLAVAKRTTKDGRGLRFLLADVLAHVPPHRRPRHVVAPPGGDAQEEGPEHLVGTEEVARYLGVSEAVLRNWVQDGHISYHHKEWPSGRIFFSSGLLSTLTPRTQTVTAGEAAKMFGVHRVHLNEWRRKGVLTPVEGPEVNGMSRYRYRIDDIRRLVAQAKLET
jgi:predicted site-specific integrase-resolvase